MIERVLLLCIQNSASVALVTGSERSWETRTKVKRRFTGKDKENQNLPLEGDSFKRGNGSLHSSSSKPKLSGKSGSVNGGLGLSVKES